MFRHPSIALSFVVLAAIAGAQDLIVYSSGAPLMGEETATGPAYPGPAVPRFGIPVPVVLPPLAFPAGDATMNDTTGVITYTNGMILAQASDPAYAPLAPIMAPAPIPPIMPLPITGIALNTATGVLWLTNGVLIGAVFMVPGLPVAVPPVPLAAIIGAAPPVTGLDWDPTTGALWAVTGPGAVYAFLPPPAFALLAGPMLPGFALPGPATDIVIARDGAPGAATGVYVQCTMGTANYTAGVVSPLPPAIPPGTASGIAFHNYPDQLLGACGCGAFAPPIVGFTGPSTIGNAGFALTVSGVPAGSPVFVAIDGVFAPGGAPWPGGCTLYMVPGSASLTITPILAGAGGVAVLAAPLPPVFGLVGATGFAQCGVPCALNPSGFVLSNMAQVVIGAP